MHLVLLLLLVHYYYHTAATNHVIAFLSITTTNVTVKTTTTSKEKHKSQTGYKKLLSETHNIQYQAITSAFLFAEKLSDDQGCQFAKKIICSFQ